MRQDTIAHREAGEFATEQLIAATAAPTTTTAHVNIRFAHSSVSSSCSAWNALDACYSFGTHHFLWALILEGSRGLHRRQWNLLCQLLRPWQLCGPHRCCTLCGILFERDAVQVWPLMLYKVLLPGNEPSTFMGAV